MNVYVNLEGITHGTNSILPLQAARKFDSLVTMPAELLHTVDGRNPFRTTWKPWKTIVSGCLQGSHQTPGFLRWCHFWISSIHSSLTALPGDAQDLKKVVLEVWKEAACAAQQGQHRH